MRSRGGEGACTSRDDDVSVRVPSKYDFDGAGQRFTKQTPQAWPQMPPPGLRGHDRQPGRAIGLHVPHLEPHELGDPQPQGEAEQQNRPVPMLDDVGRASRPETQGEPMERPELVVPPERAAISGLGELCGAVGRALTVD